MGSGASSRPRPFWGSAAFDELTGEAGPSDVVCEGEGEPGGHGGVSLRSGGLGTTAGWGRRRQHASPPPSRADSPPSLNIGTSWLAQGTTLLR